MQAYIQWCLAALGVSKGTGGYVIAVDTATCKENAMFYTNMKQQELQLTLCR